MNAFDVFDALETENTHLEGGETVEDGEEKICRSVDVEDGIGDYGAEGEDWGGR